MRQALAIMVIAGLVAFPIAASADETPNTEPAPEHTPIANQSNSNTKVPPSATAVRAQVDPKTAVGPVAVTAKRTHPRLELKLTSQSMNRVLDESGVEPVAESDTTDMIEVTAHHVEQEPIMMGIPALFYGITHPTEAWRIFAPIQP